MDPRTARRFMSVAERFSASPERTSLAHKAGSQSAVFELLVLDDGQLDSLSEEGHIGELEADDIGRMSRSELRQALRELRSPEAIAKIAKHHQKALEAVNDRANAWRAKAEDLQYKQKTALFKPATLAARRESTVATLAVGQWTTYLLEVWRTALASDRTDGERALRCESVGVAVAAALAEVCRLADIVKEESAGDIFAVPTLKHHLQPEEIPAILTNFQGVLAELRSEAAARGVLLG